MTRQGIAFLFPGQGSYVPGVLPMLGRNWAAIREIFRALDSTCGEAGVSPIGDILDESPAPAIEALVKSAPERLQFILYGTSVAAFSLLRELGHEPTRLIGHSLGEIAALVCGGAYSIEDGARIIHARNRALKASAYEGAMLAVAVDGGRADALVRLLDDPRLRVACYNGPRQCVISGPRAALDEVQAIMTGLGLGVTPVTSAYPFHNPILAPAVAEFEDAIAGLRQRPLARPVYSPISGRFYEDGDDLAQSIAGHLVRPVRFAEAVRGAHGSGIDRFVECGAGAALTGLVGRTVPSVRTEAPLAGTDALQTALTARSIATSGTVPTPPVVVLTTREPSFAQSTAGATAVAEPSRPATAATVVALQPELRPSSSVDAGRPAGAREETAATIRKICADLLGYPPEVFEEDADLESELGIDSIKRVELALTILRRLGLPADSRIDLGASTFGELVTAVVGLQQKGPGR